MKAGNGWNQVTKGNTPTAFSSPPAGGELKAVGTIIIN